MLTQRNLSSATPQNVPDGLVLLSVQSIASPVASVSFTTGIDGTYDQYWVEWNNVSLASGNVLQASLIVAGAPQASGYLSHYSIATNSSGSTYTSFSPGAYILCHNSLGGAGDVGAGSITLFGPASTSAAKLFLVDAVCTYSALSAMTITVGNGAYTSNMASPVTGIQFNSAVTINSGTFRLYGVRNK